MAAKTQTQVVVYQVDPSGGTGARVGTGSLIDPLFVLINPSLSPLLSAQLATQPDAPNLRLGIGSLANDGGAIEIIDVREIIEVYEHDGERVVALELARPSAAAFDPVFPVGGTVPSEEKDLVQAVSTYLEKATPPDDAGASTGPPADLQGPPPPVFYAWFCKLKPKDPRCKKNK
jgi:hypothetical protein